MSRVVVITGASGGIGLAAAKRFRQAGDTVYCLSRRPTNEGGIIPVVCDVTSEQRCNAVMREIADKEGRIDLLVCNAGFGISGPVEFTSNAEAKRQFELNFFGAHNSAKAAAPHMRTQKVVEGKRGQIIFISSVAAVVPIPFQAFYSASKAAINSLAGALANELRPFGVKVSALMPGDIKTGFTEARQKSSVGSGVYTKLEAAVAAMEKDERNGMPPEFIAGCLFSIAAKRNPKPLYTAGFGYSALTLLQRLLPGRLVSWLVSKLYG